MNQIGRRSFAMTLLTASSFFFASAFAGCENVVASITAYVGLGVSAVTSVVGVLTGAGIVTTAEGMAVTAVLALIKTAWADVSAAIAEYDNAPAASKQSALGKVSTALQAVADQIQKFWNDLSIPNSSLSATISGLLGVVISTIAGFMTQLPAPAVALKSYPKMLSVAPKKRTPREFRAAFNDILDDNNLSKYGI